MHSTLYYGPCTAHTYGAAMVLTARHLGRKTAPLYYAEHGPNGIRLNNKEDRRIAAARRNQTAAMMCAVLVVIGRPKYAQAIVRTFRARGRRVLWYNTKTSTLHDTETMRDYLSIDRMKLPKDCTFEPTLWEEQTRERQQQIDEYLYTHPQSLRTPDSIPTFGWTETFDNRDFDIPETDALHYKHHGGSIPAE